LIGTFWHFFELFENFFEKVQEHLSQDHLAFSKNYWGAGWVEVDAQIILVKIADCTWKIQIWGVEIWVE